MSESSTFAEILNELLTDTESPPPSSTEQINNFKPDFASDFMSEVFLFKTTSLAKYKVNRTTLKSPESITSPKHSFTQEQSKAFFDLNNIVPGLTESFSHSQLKAHYRKAALLTHPDRGGSNESFQAVKKSIEILSTLVK